MRAESRLEAVEYERSCFRQTQMGEKIDLCRYPNLLSSALNVTG